MTNEEQRQYYLNALKDKRDLLKAGIEGMGKGDLLQALNIAVTIRALAHQTTKQTPLLKCLRPDFLDLPILGMVLATQYNPLRLPLMLAVSSQEPHLRLITEMGGGRTERMTLSDWWEGPFVALPETGFFSRKDVVVGLADKEAAHVDKNISANFKRLIECDKFSYVVNDQTVPMINLSRLIVGGAGVELLGYIDEHFPGSKPPTLEAQLSPSTLTGD